jgi:hypothetical protein
LRGRRGRGPRDRVGPSEGEEEIRQVVKCAIENLAKTPD